MELKGKAAFVTGGSGDIGGAIARALAAAGADVAISYVGQLDAAAAMVDALRAAGSRSLAVQLDQRDPMAIDASVDRQVVLRRVASTQDIAAQVVMFCGAESITGQVLVIDGGMPGGMH